MIAMRTTIFLYAVGSFCSTLHLLREVDAVSLCCPPSSHRYRWSSRFIAIVHPLYVYVRTFGCDVCVCVCVVVGAWCLVLGGGGGG